MKAFEWHRRLTEQSRRYGKRLFFVSELANLAGTSAEVTYVELHRLVQRGILQRYAKGIYGQPDLSDPAVLLPFLDDSAYITGGYALSAFHQIITQVHTAITCFGRRHHMRGKVPTALGEFRFYFARGALYRKPETGVIAPPEQAFLDYVYLIRQSGLKPESQVTFRNLNRLDRAAIDALSSAYPDTVIRQVRELLA